MQNLLLWGRRNEDTISTGLIALAYLSLAWQGFRTHNFALESLLLYGIVGSILNLFILYFLIRSFRCKKNLPYLMAFLGALVHGLFEPNFFTLHFELFLWLMIGISLRNADCPGGYRLFGKKQRKE